METEQIQTVVNLRLLAKAGRLFTGTVEGRIIEILQNSRRAGATTVDIHNQEGWIRVWDNGRGIDDFSRLLDLGGSGWNQILEESEDPAGVGFFCLSGRDVVIRSHGKQVTITQAGWTGTPVDVIDDPRPVTGTLVCFLDEAWTMDQVAPHAVFSRLRVKVDGKACPALPFVSEHAHRHPALGCRIETRTLCDLHPWHKALRRRNFVGNVLVNFHGQVVTYQYHPTHVWDMFFLVDMEDAMPTGIRLMLPARVRLIENDALRDLNAAIEQEACRYFQREGRHGLFFQEYLRARELGIDLPEATATFEVGTLSGDTPYPVEVVLPKDFPLANCYRVTPELMGHENTAAANVHLLGALGKFQAPFIPVAISRNYDGYRWADLPLVVKLEITSGTIRQEDCLWSGKLVCVDYLSITAYTRDGMTISSPVCMAVLDAPEEANRWHATRRVLVTTEARTRLCASEIWYHLGGWYEDGDTYDTQLLAFEKDLDHFWATIAGPDEPLRQTLVQGMQGIGKPWKSVTIHAQGKVAIRYNDGSIQTIVPP